MYYDLFSEPHLFGIPTLTALLFASIFIRRLPAFSLRQAAMTTSSLLQPAVATETPAIRIPSAAACLKTMTKAASSGQGIAGTAHVKPGGAVAKAPKSRRRRTAVPDFEQTFRAKKARPIHKFAIPRANFAAHGAFWVVSHLLQDAYWQVL